MKSYLEATARERIEAVFDAASFREFLPPERRVVSPHLAQLDAPVSFDDGVAVGAALLGGVKVFAAAQEGGFMGGAVGEVHGAKLAGMLRAAVQQRAAAVVLLLESGGVRLHEANAGLIAVSEVMRAVFDTRAAGIPVLALIGGANGCFGGMGIVARCANVIIMSDEARLGMSGPEVIETASGVEDFDSQDRALVWRTTGGKHRTLMGDSAMLVDDDAAAFRQATIDMMARLRTTPAELTMDALEAEQQMLAERLQRFGGADDALDIWTALGVPEPRQMPLLDAASFMQLAASHGVGVA
jgi:malonate decarboxylase beta subunit